jgi:biotin transport system permease protein
MIAHLGDGTRGWLGRVPAGIKLLMLADAAVATLVLVRTVLHVIVATGILLLLWLASRVGLAALARQLWALRWMVLLLVATQLLFVSPSVAAVTTTRVVVVLLLAGLLSLTTRVSELLAAFQSFLRPLRVIGLDGDRVALVLALTITTVPLLGRLATTIREGRAARGARTGVLGYGVPLLVLALQHADELGDAIDARGG